MTARLARFLVHAAVALWPPERHADACRCPLHRVYALGHDRGYHACAKEAARREAMLVAGFGQAQLDALETLAGRTS